MPQQDIAWAVEELRGRSLGYTRLRNYLRGDHNLTFATEKFRNAFGNLFQKFAVNMCPAVVEAPSTRMKIQSWDGDNKDLVEPIWDKNSMPRQSSRVHLGMFGMGDAFTIVWPDATGFPRIWHQKANQMVVKYDDEYDPTLVVQAAKVWCLDDGHWRVNLYYPDHIEKYVSNRGHPNGVTSKYMDYHEFEKPTANPWGVVPVFHFPNGADIGDYGTSILHNILPIQDALNKAVTDMMVAMEFVAFPQRWVTGLQVENDPDTGKPKVKPFTPGVDRVWSGSENAKFGEFPMAELGHHIVVQDGIKLDMARISGIPAHFLYLAKTMPSGEALKVAEGRMVSLIQESHLVVGDVWKRQNALAIEMSGGPDHDEVDLKPVWASPAPNNPLLDAETQLVKEQVGVSQRQALRELGYSDGDIERMEEENAAAVILAAATMAQAGLMDPNAPGAPSGGSGKSPGNDPSGKPTAFNRNGSPGKASKPAPQQQSARQPVSRLNGLTPGTIPTAISPARPRSSSGQYGEPN